MNKNQLILHLKNQNFSGSIVNAFKKVKREDFISKEHIANAYEDAALPIGYGATISQPSTIAFMLSILELNKKLKKILEIGSGSGYVLALLSEITGAEIYGVEIIPELAESSRRILKDCKNIIIIDKSGKSGLPEHYPYDRILISASCSEIPSNLLSQLKDNGIIVASVKNSILKIKKTNGKVKIDEYPGFVFVPLVD